MFIDIQSEEELLDLYRADEIDEQDYETLVELLDHGVDINVASRKELYDLPNLTYADVDAVLAYREQVGYIEDIACLGVANVLTERKLKSVYAFLVIRKHKLLKYATYGRVEYHTAYVGEDEKVPSMWARFNITTLRNVDVGLAGVVTRTRIRDVRYDPNRDALSALAPSVQIHIPKFYLQRNTTHVHMVAGTYKIGFGERLTFDNTTYNTPNGIQIDNKIYHTQDLARKCRESQGELTEAPCTKKEANAYQSPDYRWTDRLQGIAVGLRELDVGIGKMQVYGFASLQSRDIYQYEIYDRAQCKDPQCDDDPNCKAPYVYKRLANPLAPTSRFRWSVLPNMFREFLAGGNVSYFLNPRTHLGITGYGATINWLVDGMELDFQEWSRIPYGGSFGAFGVDGAWGHKLFDLMVELSRSFDSQGTGGGGWAGVLRSVFTLPKHEFELALRYYSQDFANPYARPISAADEYDGLRARDETGLRLRHTGTVGRLQLHSTADFWAELSDQVPRMYLRVRADYALLQYLIPGIWIAYQDKDLSDSSRANCYETPFSTPAQGEPEYCQGEKIQVGTQLKFAPIKRLSVTAKYQYSWVDDGSKDFVDKFRCDTSAYLMVSCKPTNALRMRVRVRYLFEDIFDNKYLDQSLWTYVEGIYSMNRMFQLKLRYELYAWLDNRANTYTRDPGPAHWVRLDIVCQF